MLIFDLERGRDVTGVELWPAARIPSRQCYQDGPQLCKQSFYERPCMPGRDSEDTYWTRPVIEAILLKSATFKLQPRNCNVTEWFQAYLFARTHSTPFASEQHLSHTKSNQLQASSYLMAHARYVSRPRLPGERAAHQPSGASGAGPPCMQGGAPQTPCGRDPAAAAPPAQHSRRPAWRR